MPSPTSSLRNTFARTEIRRLQDLLPPELQAWVKVLNADGVRPPLISCEEAGGDEVVILVDMVRWERMAEDQRNLLFWHEVARIQNDAVPKDGWEVAALAIGLGGAVGELWVQNGLLFVLALGICGVAGFQLWRKGTSKKDIRNLIEADQGAIRLAVRNGYPLPAAYKSLGSALKIMLSDVSKGRSRTLIEKRLDALRNEANKARRNYEN
ncbi:DUF3318 domain-containing protein [Pseudanabaena sp. FACHB-1998]|uniref:DUF3318 domain-containing protein n=1 Tax=Pseudanabaena sp. FACHB-1998 TaxID=2692858 RepID=UPI00168123E4|nr:DUF3318 domain-containing protein [Pseudanabaena sp. FACHB-1998]MBD2175762.1 DUF3318 domain-containing protein [Pseudanabaena sp. FACHB-1998]